MKFFLGAVFLAGFFLMGCAHPLERVAEAHRQQRIQAAYAGKPINFGSGDGVGGYTALSVGNGLTLPDHPPSP